MNGKSLLPLVWLFCGFCACSSPPSGEIRKPSQPHWKKELLATAFQAATSFPLDPHIKNRSRDQEKVVDVCLKTGLYDLALHWIPKIKNWRQGSAYADLAFFLLRGDARDLRSKIPLFLHKARKIAEEARRSPNSQEWRVGRILAKIARAELLLGRKEAAQGLAKSLPPSEAGIVQLAQARNLKPEELRKHLESLGKNSSLEDFEEGRTAMALLGEAYRRFFRDKGMREFLEKQAQKSFHGLPLDLRLKAIFSMADVALRQGNKKAAHRLVQWAGQKIKGIHLLAEHQIPLLARLAALRGRMGEREGAEQGLELCLSLFRKSRKRIINVFRAEVLLPVAEAYFQLGKHEQAVGVYEKALQEAWVNPNSRPRADDLVRICCSLVLNGCKPSPRLGQNLKAAQKGLGDPW